MKDKKDGSDDTIKIFLRIKPSNKISRNYQIDKDFGHDIVRFHLGKNAAGGLVNNTREDFSFKFSRVFDTSTTQEEIFDGIARPAVQSALQGFNSTIFAYGQTGSGKTFTITGGTAAFQERGIIPRSIAMIYQELNKQTDFEWSTRISYLQIYNEKGSDLLNRGSDANSLDDLPKVTITEDADEVILRGLEMHVSNSVEDALNLLFLGDTNRMYCETPMNQTSSRSHCVFTIGIEAKAPGSSVVRRSKLHLVDLAGSERVGKTGVEGNLLSEAKYINLSLHYLEQVITALAEKSEGKRDHIPYRNSFMTQVLRDSLGGNCKTVMIATAHSQDAFMDESISTCRFAQRVASIKQAARINEETDPKLLIRKLKQEIAELKEELSFYKKGDQADDRALSLDEVERCKAIVKDYLDNTDPEARIVGLQADMSRMMFCYRIMKDIILEKSKAAAGGKGGSPADSQMVKGLQEQLRVLQLNLQQKDNEIHLLLNVINKSKAGNAAMSPSTASRVSGLAAGAGPSPPAAPSAPVYTSPPVREGPDAAAMQQQQQQLAMDSQQADLAGAYDLEALADPALLKDRTAAYEAFRKSYRKCESIEKSKAELKEKYMQAKRLGAEVNDLSQRIQGLKTRVQQIRAERAATGQTEPDAEETAAFQDLNAVKDGFRKKAQELQQQRAVIEHYHLMLEQAQKQLTKDFNQWYDFQERQQQRSQKAAAVPVMQQSQVPVSLPTAQLGFAGVQSQPGGYIAPSAAPPVGSGFSVNTGHGAGDAELQRLLQARDKRKA
uniref:Kinesin-like protein n=1 Tax=Eutreptiella gymnastica TaxID=73025 RepID=A0A7S1N5Q6_9EUGL|mmetsp:Transcript_124254/g.215397  ORF Transcript_124254/g.215397 Transcript_124254/m.215397 type:complete len:780 (+) Transcript_124254:90-2429(+)